MVRYEICTKSYSAYKENQLVSSYESTMPQKEISLVTLIQFYENIGNNLFSFFLKTYMHP